MASKHLVLVLVIYCQSLAMLNCSSNKPFNIDYLGIGYDVLKGNPHNRFPDPGFREAVFHLDYSENKESSDGRWLIPDKVELHQVISCSFVAESTIIRGASSYRDFLFSDAYVYGYGYYEAFSASSGFWQVYESTYNYHRKYVSSVAKCSDYSALLDRDAGARLTDAFRRSVYQLPTVINNASYLEFIGTYGTHYIKQITMGSKAIVRSEFDDTTWSSLVEDGFNFRSAANDYFLQYHVGASSYVRDSEMADTFNIKASSVRERFIGCRPPADGNLQTWAASTSNSPYPIAYELRPLTDLFSSSSFPNLTADELTTKASLLISAFEIYCDGLQGCGLPPPDRRPSLFKLDAADIITRQSVTCSRGYSLASCGLSSTQLDNPDPLRSAVPVDSRTCQCSANFGMSCKAWCTNSVQGFSIQSLYGSGTFDVFCPEGSKVLGCHMDSTGNSNAESWPAHYPLVNGVGCRCYDEYGTNCVASCATNIINEEVRSQFGRGNITVDCSAGNFVLGCGIQPTSPYGPDLFREVQPSSLSSCRCYDETGATCYATCGQFA